jgi:hypothetical protein
VLKTGSSPRLVKSSNTLFRHKLPGSAFVAHAKPPDAQVEASFPGPEVTDEQAMQSKALAEPVVELHTEIPFVSELGH